MKSLRRILYATDFSRASDAAFARAVAVARDNHAQLLIVHVLSLWSPFVRVRNLPSATYLELQAASHRWVQQQVANLLIKVKRARMRVKVLLLEGEPHQRIVELARKKRADLVVIGTHGRTGLPKFLVGSVAERVVRLAPCPVMTVRGK